MKQFSTNLLPIRPKNMFAKWSGIGLLLLLLTGYGPLVAQTSFSGLPAQMCTTDGNVSLTGSPTGGTFAGPGVTGTTFSPSSATAGTHTVTYTPPRYSLSTVAFQGISGGGTTISLGDNANSSSVPLGFSFNYFDVNYTTAVISSNGFITFTTGQTANAFAQTIPNAAAPNNRIAFYHADLDPGNGLFGAGNNRIWYTTIGTAPNREWRLSFWRVDQFAIGNNITVRLRLFETSNNIRVDILSAPSDGGAVAIGIENQNGTVGFPAVNGVNPGTITNQSYQWTPQLPASQTAQVFLQPNAPNPGSNQSVAVNSTTMAATAANVGTGTWSVISGTGTFGNANSPTSTVSGLSTGNNVFGWTITNGTCTTTTGSVTVSFNNDVTPPVVTCPGTQQPTLNVNCQLALPDFRSSVTVNDAIDPNPTLVQNPAPGSLVVGTGSFTVTMTATDASGNADSCTFTVAPRDITDPSITCPSTQTVFLGSGCNYTMPDFTSLATTSDNCDTSITVTQSPNAGLTFTSGQSVQLVGTDDSFNSATCTFSITTQDTVSPTASCQDISLHLDGSGSVSFSATALNNGSSDNCSSSGQLTFSISADSFNCSNIGANPVTLSVTDGAGNIGSCVASVSVLDSIPPTAVCNDQTLFLDGSGNAGTTASSLSSGSSDNCGVAGSSASPGSFTCSDLGNNTVNVTVRDVSLNQSSCTAIVTVQDSIVPIAVCQDISIQLDGSGNAMINASDIDGGSTDACGIQSLSVSLDTFSCANIGLNSVTLTVTDSAGNSGMCTAFVTVMDTVPPMAMCQDVTVFLGGSGFTTIGFGDIDNGSNDNCSIGGTMLSNISFACGDVGMNSVLLTVTDMNSNVDTCSANVTVNDSIPPTAICQNATVQLDTNGFGSITAISIDSNSIDNCTIGSISVSDTSFGCADIGSNTVTLTVTDVNGNSSTCSGNVTVEDNLPPMAVCQDITVFLDGSGNAVVTPSDINNGSSDNCSIASVAVNDTAFTCADIGTNTIRLGVIDIAGNFDTCSATVTVIDSIAPTAVCQNVTVQLDSIGQGSLSAVDVDSSSTDNCAIANFTVSDTAFGCADVGSNTVTLTVNDVNGNSSSCTATITVEDNIPPMAVCQDLTVQLDSNGMAGITTNDVDNGSSDACGIGSISVSDTAFACADVGANAVTLTVTDVNGNVDTCSASITVEDNLPPTAMCQDITVFLDGSGNVNITASDIENGSGDNCSLASLVLSDTAFACVHVGSNNVLLTVVDAGGNTDTCSATVTVNDSLAPTAVCQNVTVQLDSTGQGSLSAMDVDSSSFDNCAIANFTVSDTTFGCADVGSNTVTLTVTDVNGNSSTCASTVTVEDNVPPMAMCQDITVQLDSNGTVGITANDVDNGSSDACGIASITVSDTAFTCADVGGNGVTLTVTDVNGNVDTCSATITVEDNIPPMAMCQDITVFLDGSGNATIGTADIDNSSSDNCAIGSLVLSDTAFACADVGANMVMLTVTDVNGNVDTCSATVTVTDSIAPTAICQNVTVQLDSAGMGSLTAMDVDSSSFDNCGIANISVSDTTFGCADVGSNTVTLTVTDVNGNSSTCASTITVEDNVPPMAMCQDITVQLDSNGTVGITANDVDNGSSDACGIASVTVSDTAFTCADVGGNGVTLTVTDVNGNVDTCSATITVEDNIPPMAMCQDITVFLDGSGNATIGTADIDNSSSDNCAIGSLVLSDTAFACADVGANMVMLTVTDVNGNVDTCSATVTVTDSIAPTAICQNVTVQLDSAGMGSLTAMDVDSSSFDNCGIANISVSDTTFGCADVGSNTVTLTVTDVNGNSSTCTATITVEDNVPPIAMCQDITVQLDSNGTVGITANDVDNGSSDACGVASTTVSDTVFTCADVGGNGVTLTVTDVNGNVDTCSATITVEDNIPPMAMCQDITVFLDGSGNATIGTADIDNNSSDNCSISSLVLSDTAFACADVGANMVMLTVTDVNGNVDTCSATVTVTDSIAPTAICQNVTVQLDSAGMGSLTAMDVDSSSFDNCGIANISVSDTAFGCADVGSNTVTLTVNDVNGNSSSCTATVTVEDNVPPMAMCQDITVQLDSNGTVGITANDVDNGSSDACGIASITVSDTAFTCADVGGNGVTLTVTDVNGNVDTCSATITVEDNIPPMAMCQDITVFLDGSGNATIGTADIDNSSSDNCSISSLVLSDTAFACADVGANMVMLTVTDVNGNVDTCSATVTVTDSIAPTAICQNVTVQLDSAGMGSLTAMDVDSSSFDNCGIVNISVSDTAFGCADVGSNTVTLTVTDVNGNSSSCTATITVEDNVPPMAMCQDITVQLDSNGTVGITANDVDNGSSDACGIGSITVSDTAFTCADVGANAVTLTVTDVNGNVDTCSASITVEDNVPPMAMCQDITVFLDGSGNATIGTADIDNNSSDNCAVGSLVLSDTAFDCGDVPQVPMIPVGAWINEFHYDNTGGDVGEMIEIAGSAGLDLSGWSIVLYNGSNGTTYSTIPLSGIIPDAGAGLGFVSNLISGIQNGGPDGFALIDNQSSVVEFLSYEGSFTATNGPANSMTSTDVGVSETSNSLAGLSLQLAGSGVQSSDFSWAPSATETPGAVNNNQIVMLPLAGPNTVVLTVTDVNGNVDTCSATVTVVDSIAPIAQCQNVTVQLDSNGMGSLNAMDVDSSSFDNCGIANISVSDTAFACNNAGANLVTLTVTDVSGNVSTCDATVTVEDTIAPVATCPAPIVMGNDSGQCGAIATWTFNSSDNCSVAGVSSTANPGDFFPVGTTTVGYTISDSAGNVDSCSFDVTINDTEAPVAICPAPIVTSNDTGVCGANVTWVFNSTDNCGVDSVGSTSNPGDFFVVGITNVIYTVTDSAGNIDTCSFDVTVNDTELPTITCPIDTILVADSANCASSYTWPVPTGADNCVVDSVWSSVSNGSAFPVGLNSVTYFITDISGNLDSCSFNITVNAQPLAIAVTSSLYNCGHGVSCNGSNDGSATVALTGGCQPYTISWSNGDSTLTAGSLVAGSYTVTVTDSLGSSLTDTILLTEPTAIMLSLVGDSVCAGSSTGGIDLTAAGGNDCQAYDYAWSNGDTTEDLSGLPAGIYTVTVTDVSGCSQIDSIEISSLPLPVINLGPDTSFCAGNSYLLDAGFPFVSYNWNTGDTTQTLLTTAPGQYTVTISDIFGCTNSDTVDINYFTVADSFITPRADLLICRQDSILLDAGSGFVDVMWSTGDTTQNLLVAGFGGWISAVGTDSNGCQATDSVFVQFVDEDNPRPEILPGPVYNLCAGADIALSAQGYFSYNWNTGDTTQSIIVSTAGAYVVTVSNGFGCLGVSDTVTVVSVPNPTPTISLVNDTFFVAGTYITYQWNLDGTLIPGAILDFYEPTMSGFYSITVTDSNGCEAVSDSIFFDTSVGAEAATDELFGIELYPNPTSGIVFVRSLEPINWDVDITIMDMYGQLVKTFQVGNLHDAKELDLTDIANGMYLLKVEDKKGRAAMIRFMIE